MSGKVTMHLFAILTLMFSEPSFAKDPNKWITEKEVPQFSCPKGTFLETSDMNEKMYFCCATKTPPSSSCHQKEGPFSTWSRREGPKNGKIFQRLRSGSYKSNKLDGKYSSRHHETGKVIVEGAFIDGSPTGKWIQRDKDGNTLVEASYVGNSLAEITVTEKGASTSQKITNFQEPNKYFENRNAMSLGVIYPEKPSFLYSSWSSDKKVVGFSSGGMRFYYSAICLQFCDPANDGAIWTVLEKIKDMCRVVTNPNEYGSGDNHYSVWVGCKNQFIPVLEMYKNGMSYISSNAILYNRPGGKRKEMAFDKDHLKRLTTYLYPEHAVKHAKGSSETFEAETLKIQSAMNDRETEQYLNETYSVKIIDSEIFNGEIWVEVELIDSCGKESKYKGRGWLPFYLNKRIQLGMYQSC